MVNGLPLPATPHAGAHGQRRVHQCRVGVSRAGAAAVGRRAAGRGAGAPTSLLCFFSGPQSTIALDDRHFLLIYKHYVASNSVLRRLLPYHLKSQPLPRF
jgi:hypothetical protein